VKRGFLVARCALGFVVAGAYSDIAMAEAVPSSGASDAEWLFNRVNVGTVFII